jgi:RNA polymerase sigma factor (sigma-70 family)
VGTRHLHLLEQQSSHSRPRERVVLVPAVESQGPIPDDIDRKLGHIAIEARRSPQALAALYWAFLPRLDHWVFRATHSCFRPSADPAIEPEDIEQEAFVVFADLVLAWGGEMSLSAYLIRYFPWRLSDAIRCMSNRRPRPRRASVSAADLGDGSHGADEALALLESLAAQLPRRQGELLLLRFRDRLTWFEVAHRLGVDVRTAHREWSRLKPLLRKALLSDA